MPFGSKIVFLDDQVARPQGTGRVGCDKCDAAGGRHLFYPREQRDPLPNPAGEQTHDAFTLSRWTALIAFLALVRDRSCGTATDAFANQLKAGFLGDLNSEAAAGRAMRAVTITVARTLFGLACICVYSFCQRRC
jgi:hypothetical protein